MKLFKIIDEYIYDIAAFLIGGTMLLLGIIFAIQLLDWAFTWSFWALINNIGFLLLGVFFVIWIRANKQNLHR